MIATRRRIAAFVAALLLLVAWTPLLLSGSPGTLPACCRANGKHHCMMAQTPADGFSAVKDKCGEFPKAMAAAHFAAVSLSRSEAVYTGPAVHPTGIAQTEARYREAHGRTRQKRGPPQSPLA